MHEFLGNTAGIGRRERNEDIARAITTDGSQASKCQRWPFGNSTKLVRKQGRVSGDYDDYGTVTGALGFVTCCGGIAVWVPIDVTLYRWIRKAVLTHR